VQERLGLVAGCAGYLVRLQRLLLAGPVLVALLMSIGGPVRAQNKLDTVRIMLNPTVLTNLPILVAIDRGYFTKQNINLDLKKFAGSSATITAALARGDLDIAPQGPAPAFFNQFDAGFNAKVIAGITGTRPGYDDISWMVVRQDLWQNGTIRKLSDLRGKTVDSANVGTPLSLNVLGALEKANLTPADVKLTSKLGQTSDWVAALTNKAYDVVATVEPQSSLLESQGLGHKWIGLAQVAPWYQSAFVAVSNDFLKGHRDVVVRFLVAFLQGERDVEASRGHWTPELAKEVETWTGLTHDAVMHMPGPVDPGDRGAIDLASMRRAQNFWMAHGGLVKSNHLMGEVMDDGPLIAARRQVPKR
jgi:NitT/TauT family transport system substrate-binding protein